ncbi:hypothetical protein [Streptomyces sp. MP131-18]|uniref:hypothetical protein n=1 Tax=Streptomyces sp. MP131-18 TaxID=1857892 RepID=UPI00097C4E8F|nr:hypothetical protein [Streptomyces sp. MP131-18]ONK14375.1 hypothetical protein STBA_51600 [Streptomyces sp. MP131-18]
MADLYVEYQSVRGMRDKVSELHTRLRGVAGTARGFDGDAMGVVALASVVDDTGEEWERETGQLAQVFDRAVDSLDDVLSHFQGVEEELRQRATRD